MVRNYPYLSNLKPTFSMIKLICHVYKISMLHFRRDLKFLYLKQQNIQRTNTAISKENAQHSQFCCLKVSIESCICKTNLDIFCVFYIFIFFIKMLIIIIEVLIIAIEMLIITLSIDNILLVWE